MPLSRLLAASLCIVTALHGQAPVRPAPLPKRIAIVNATVLDGTGHGYARGRTILIEDSLIVAIVATGSQTVPPEAQVIDVAGRFVIPGLIDTHAHIATDP